MQSVPSAKNPLMLRNEWCLDRPLREHHVRLLFHSGDDLCDPRELGFYQRFGAAEIALKGSIVQSREMAEAID
jgi:hypothetical protein